MEVEFEFHEAANLFPLDEESIPDLAKDIADNKQAVPIEIFESQILDGRRRYLACRLAGVTPVTRVIEVSNPYEYSISLNLHRRHLTKSQISLALDKVRDIYDREAKKRQREHRGTAPGKKSLVAISPQVIRTARTREVVGKLGGVGGHMMDDARKVNRSGNLDLIKAVQQGNMTVSLAADIADLPPEQQAVAIKRPQLIKEAKIVKQSGGSKATMAEICRWAGKRKSVSREEIAEHFGVDPGNLKRSFTAAIESRGYVIDETSGGEKYVVRKAAHFALDIPSDSMGDAKDAKAKLIDLIEQYKLSEDATFCGRWDKDDTHKFMFAMENFLKRFL